MDCQAKDGLIIFLLILSGILTAIVTGALIFLCRKKVTLFIYQIAQDIHKHYLRHSSIYKDFAMFNVHHKDKSSFSSLMQNIAHATLLKLLSSLYSSVW